MFIKCLSECMQDKEFVREFDRLNETKMEEYLASAPDFQQGLSEDAIKFINYVLENVWRPKVEAQEKELFGG